MENKIKIFKVDFNGIYPIGSCLIIAAFNKEQAEEIASDTILHTSEFTVEEITIDRPMVIEYLDGDY